MDVSDVSIDVEAALAISDNLVFVKTGKHLSTLQAQIFRGAWSGCKYEEIAINCHCSDIYIKASGARLWEFLSAGLEEQVSKKTFRAALERYSLLNSDLTTRKIPPATVEESSQAPATSDRSNPSPLVATDIQLVEGPVELGSKLYVERPLIEARCYNAILTPGVLLRIKATRQMGKTSLLARILDRANEQAYHTVCLNLQLVDSQNLQDLDRFLQWFCARVTHSLQLPTQLANYWDRIFGSKTSCKDYFESYLLPQLDQPLVLALDNVDEVLQAPETAFHFFALLRAWYEEAKNSKVWQKLRLVLAYSTEVYIPLNTYQSPFNVGICIELPDFSPVQVEELAQRYKLNWNQSQVSQLMNMVGGHPYLLQMALYQIVQHQMTLKELLRVAPTEAGPYSNHLRQHLRHLQQQPELATAFLTVIETNKTVHLESLVIFKLNSLGLIHLQDNEVMLRCELYRQYFRDRLLPRTPIL
ncbi:MAG: AAA-like domain-containing protein [Desmonostoc vinosum HA7617-LM4]|jgi:hypothetical protein|nr:AAA-like domain-containing protein [Desmonostoc vinosum HA7617-LM4]